MLVRGFAVLAIAGLLIWSNAFGQATNSAREELQHSVTVAEYCEQFARKYFHTHENSYLENSTETKKALDIFMWFSNFFQPSDSKFTSGYQCIFQTKNEKGEIQLFSVGLFLTKTMSFAEFTQWEDLQVVPIKYVVDPDNGRSGFGVFKYFEMN